MATKKAREGPWACASQRKRVLSPSTLQRTKYNKLPSHDGPLHPTKCRQPTQAPTRRQEPRRRVNPPFTRTTGPDPNSRFGCHNDPIEGGSGDLVANAFVSEGFESAQFDNTDPSFSSERHTIALTGAGLVELLAREMTADLKATRAVAGARYARFRQRAIFDDRRRFPGRPRHRRMILLRLARLGATPFFTDARSSRSSSPGEAPAIVA